MPLGAGIISGLFYEPDTGILLAVAGVLLIVLGLVAFFTKRYKSVSFGLLLFPAFFITGLLLYTAEKERIPLLENTEAVMSGTVSDYPDEKQSSVLVVLKLQQVIQNGILTKPGGGSVMVYLKKDVSWSSMKPGDHMAIRCNPLPVINRGNPFEFNYRLYALNNGIRYYCFAGQQDIIDFRPASGTGIRERALIARQRIIEMYSERGIRGQNLAVVAAITLGQKKLLDEEQKDNFIKAGIMHIMAVSGLHAMILSLLVFKVLSFMGKRLKWLRSLTAITVLWMFAFITGLTPSVIRAVTMFTFLQSGTLLRRPVNALNSVVASAFFIITIKPSALFGTGFLLSYSAVVFLICFTKGFTALLPGKNKLLQLVWKPAAVTIVAQAGTLPLSLFSFNRVPVLFIISNLVILPLTTVIIIAAILVIVTYRFKLLSGLIAFLLNKIVGMVNVFTAGIAGLPFSSVGQAGIMSFETILMLIATFLVFDFLTGKKKSGPLLLLSALLLFTLGTTLKHMITASTSDMTVYNDASGIAVGIRKGSTLFLFSDSGDTCSPALRHAAVLNLNIETHSFEGNSVIAEFNNKKLLIAEKFDKIMADTFTPDLIVAGRIDHQAGRFNGNRVTPSTIIFPGNIYRSDYLDKAAADAGADSIYYIRASGAFRYRLK